MFGAIFAFGVIATHVTIIAGEISSYIHTCSRQDPNIDQCIINSINSLKDKICEGISELDSPPLNQFNIDNLVISDTDNAKLYVKDIKITGLCDFNINSFHVDLDKLHFDFELSFKRVNLNGTYDFDIYVLVPFVHKAPVYFVSDNVETKATMDMKMITKNNKKYVYISEINLNLDIKHFDSKFDVNENSSQLNEIISTFIGSNQEEFINRVKSPLEEKVSKQILSIANNIVKHFTYNELFPEQT